MSPENLNVLSLIGNAGLVVKLVLAVLILFSVISWAIIFIKFRFLQKAHKESAWFIDAFWKSRDLSEAFARAKQLSVSPIARVYRIGYMELKKLSRPSTTTPRDPGEPEEATIMADAMGIENVQRALRRANTSEITRLNRMIPFLATCGNTAPFIGLFGTVWGIMNSFHGIGQRGSASLAVVAPGISEALIATAVGLAVAIPAVIAFNYFTYKIRIIDSELESFSADFLNIVDRDILRMKGGRS